jgi:hypothetical protein
MDSEFKKLISSMIDYNKKVQALEILGLLIKDIEVGPNSFVQLVECATVDQGLVYWNYHQTWVDKMNTTNQKAIEGAYQGDVIGNFKIIGIYNAAPGAEEAFQKYK